MFSLAGLWLAVLALLLPADRFARLRAASCVPPVSGMVGWWSGDTDASDLAGTNNGVLHSGAADGKGLVHA